MTLVQELVPRHGSHASSRTRCASHGPDGRASLSPASRVGRVQHTSSGSPGRTRPTGFMGRVHGSETKGTSHEPSVRSRRGNEASALVNREIRLLTSAATVHGPNARLLGVGASDESGRAALPRSRSSVEAAARQHRPTGDGFKGRAHGLQTKRPAARGPVARKFAAALLLLGVFFTGLDSSAGVFTVGPDYTQPTNAVPSAYKAAGLGEWKQGQSLDHVPKGAWWEIFNDELLNELERRAAASNQELKAAIARLDQARATARVARSELLPGLNIDPTARRERFSPNQVPSFGDISANTFRAPLDLSYEIDLWGRVRRGFESARADAQASLAAFHNVLLTLQADLAQNYFALRALDAEIAAVTSTVELRREQVRLVRSRFEGGIGNEFEVARAETELATAEAETASLAKRRAELENALAILVGENPSGFRLTSISHNSSAGRHVPPHPGPLPQGPQGEGESQDASALATDAGTVQRGGAVPLSLERGQGEGKSDVDLSGESETETRSWNPRTPDIPAGLPSDLLERRPDCRSRASTRRRERSPRRGQSCLLSRAAPHRLRRLRERGHR